MTTVYEFNGDYSFLSNFHPAPVLLDHRLYPTVEHAYQAAKTFDRAAREEIRFTDRPGDAKRLGKKLELREDWPYVKQSIMLGLVLQKFQRHHLLKEKLLATPGWLEEGNTWGDIEWGICPPRSGIGQNLLGKILMTVRVYISIK